MDLKTIMKEAQKMQEEMQKAQADLAKITVRGESGGGLVAIEMNGAHEAKKVSISDSLMDDDKDMLEDLVAAAINDAVQKVETASKKKINELTSQFDLPDNLNIGDED